MSYRFRVNDDGALVLQVKDLAESGFSYPPEFKWRDATVADIPINDPFSRESPKAQERREYDPGTVEEVSPGVWSGRLPTTTIIRG